MGEAVGYGGIRPKQYDNYIELRETAVKDELIALTNHPNGVVRCYSFWALADSHSVDLLPIIIQHLNDTELVQTQFGCLGGKENVGDFFINYSNLDSNQQLKLDSILIYSNSNLSTKYLAIHRAKPTAKLYPKIRQLAQEQNFQVAKVPLAKYQRESDIELILKNHGKDGNLYTYEAITYFPNQKFMPFLEKNLNETLDDEYYDNEWRELYMAIARFKNKKALELLNIPFTKVQHENIKEYHIDFIFDALQNNLDTIYNELLWTLWEKEHKITPDVYKYLNKTNSPKAYNLTKQTLLNLNEYYSGVIGFDFDEFNSTENLTTLMLNVVLEKDKEFGLNILRENIKVANVHIFPIFADKAATLKDTSLVEALFHRLESEDNPHVYLKAVESLIAYKNETINKRILEARKINQNLNKDWGSEELDKILKTNNIK